MMDVGHSRFFTFLARYLGNFFYTQIALTLASSAILIGWGLDISLMSLVGNLVFGPFLVIFLLLSSVLTLATVLGIPCSFVATILKKFTHWWEWILKQSSVSWLFGIPEINATVLIIILLAIIFAFYRMHKLTMPKKLARVAMLTFVILATFFVVWKSKNYGSGAIELSEHLYVIKLHNTAQVIIVDNGYFNRKQSIEKAIDYELKPWLTKHYGHVTIRELRLQKPGLRSFQAALHLLECWNIKAMWMPYFDQKLSKNGWRYFFRLMYALKQKKIDLIRCRSKQSKHSR